VTAADLDRQAVRRHFSAHAGEYERYARVQQRVVERLVGVLPDSLPAGRCLDIGTGTGRLSAEISRRFAGIRPILSDLAHGMTLQARRHLPELPAVDADASALPFAPASFSLVVSASVYQWVEDLPVAFAEVARVLERDGHFVLALFGERSLEELRQAHRQALLELGSPRSSHVQSFPDTGAIAAALDLAGFEPLQLFAELEREVHPGVPALLRALKRIGAGNASSRRPPGLASRQVMERMIRIYREEFGEEGGVPATWQVVYALARKQS